MQSRFPGVQRPIPTSEAPGRYLAARFHLRTRRAFLNCGLIALVFSMFTFCSTMLAQQIPIENFNITDGLKAAHSQSVLEDDAGLLWIGHSRGLATFDGRTFEEATLPPHLVEVDIIALERDGIGGFCAVAQWTPVRVVCSGPDGWTVLPILAIETEEPLRVGKIAAIADASDLRVAVLLQSRAIKVFSHGQWHSLDLPDGLSVNDLASFDSEFRLATNRGLFRIAYDEAGFVKLGADRRGVLAISRESENGAGEKNPMLILGSGWIGSLEGDTIIGLADNLELTTLDWPIQTAVIAAHETDGIYFGTSTGLAFLDLNGGEVISIGRAEGLSGEGVNDLLVDRNGQVWIAGFRGLSVIKNRQFENFNSLHGLVGNEVASVLELSPNRILLGHDMGLTLL